MSYEETDFVSFTHLNKMVQQMMLRLHSQSKEQVKDISDNTRTQYVRGWRLNTTNCTTHLFMTHSVLVQAPKPFVLVCSCNAWVIACNNFIQSY